MHISKDGGKVILKSTSNKKGNKKLNSKDYKEWNSVRVKVNKTENEYIIESINRVNHLFIGEK